MYKYIFGSIIAIIIVIFCYFASIKTINYYFEKINNFSRIEQLVAAQSEKVNKLQNTVDKYTQDFKSFQERTEKRILEYQEKLKEYESIIKNKNLRDLYKKDKYEIRSGFY